MTILEAFSTGTPVIASNLGSMKEIIQHKINGLHFMPGSAEDLVSKIAYVCENDSISQSMGTNARSSYLEWYTPEKNYRQLISIYKYAMEGLKKEKLSKHFLKRQRKEQVGA
jgi:glycosyltransferase involved in cell wall biosynthesis